MEFAKNVEDTNTDGGDSRHDYDQDALALNGGGERVNNEPGDNISQDRDTSTMLDVSGFKLHTKTVVRPSFSPKRNFSEHRQRILSKVD